MTTSGALDLGYVARSRRARRWGLRKAGQLAADVVSSNSAVAVRGLLSQLRVPASTPICTDVAVLPTGAFACVCQRAEALARSVDGITIQSLYVAAPHVADLGNVYHTVVLDRESRRVVAVAGCARRSGYDRPLHFALTTCTQLQSTSTPQRCDARTQHT